MNCRLVEEDCTCLGPRIHKRGRASPREAVLHMQLTDVPVSDLARTISSRLRTVGQVLCEWDEIARYGSLGVWLVLV